MGYMPARVLGRSFVHHPGGLRAAFISSPRACQQQSGAVQLESVASRRKHHAFGVQSLNLWNPPSLAPNSADDRWRTSRLYSSYNNNGNSNSNITSWSNSSNSNSTNPRQRRPQHPTSAFPTRRRFSSNEHWHVPKSIEIPVEKIDLSFTKSSGAGGQNVNKVNTKVELRFHVLEAEWLPLEVRERLYEQQRGRINKKGFISMQSQEHRTQEKNRKSAISRLHGLIMEAYPRPVIRKMRTGVSKAAKARKKESKRRRSETKQGRRSVDSRDW